MALLGTFPTASIRAANPPSGTVGPSGPTVNWTGTAAGSPAGDESECVEGDSCDTFTLTVSGTAADWTGKPITIKIKWTSPTHDYDLYVHKDSNAGPLIGSSTGGLPFPTVEEQVVFNPSISGTGVYTAHVVYFDVAAAEVDQYKGSAQVTGETPPPPPPGAPRFQNYVAPEGLGNGAGEPSIGANWKTGSTLYQAGSETLRVKFDDCTSPAKATWEAKNPPTRRAFTASLDPIGFTDRQTGRCFASQLLGKDSETWFTDNDGESWIPSQGAGINSGVDHQTIGGGPFHAPLTRNPAGPVYPNAVYYCSQDVADAACAVSMDGGQTFGPAVVLYTAAQCGGLHGQVKVAPDGTAYVPNKRCGLAGTPGLIYSGQGVAVSENNGASWTVKMIPGATTSQSDPSVGIATDGTVYVGYQNGDGHPRIAVSKDRGTTWIHDQDVGTTLGIQSNVFPAVVAGDPDRAAFAFLGTTTPGNHEACSFPGAWHLYIATTYDGGQSWVTVDTTPDDPVQRGGIWESGPTSNPCRNLLDFMGATVDAQGRVLVGYADGCVGACVSGPPNSYTAKAAIARQSGGKRLFKQFDPLSDPDVPGAPQVTGSMGADGVKLSWTEPDNGGAPITAYKIYRSSTSGSGFVLIATVTGRKFHDDTADPNIVNYYRVTAVNSVGEGKACEIVVGPGFTESPCILPGLTVLTDSTGDALDGDPGHDVQRISVAEPFFGDGVEQLAFTIKVASLTSVPKDTTWPVNFAVPNNATPDPNDLSNFWVAMRTDAAGAVTFKYGTGGCCGSVSGDADAGSSFKPNGTITIFLSKSKVGSPQVGQSLTRFLTRVRVEAGVSAITPDNVPDSLTPAGSYTLVGNASCKPNNPPTGLLAATPRKGTAPLTVNFDASSSFDRDGDAITSYTFNFGDGSEEVTQSTSTVSHTYVTGGEYLASVSVKDARGLRSSNPASVVIDVQNPVQFWFPWYDGAHGSTMGPPDWLVVTNPGASPITAQVKLDFTQAGDPLDTSHALDPGEVWTPQFSGLVGGPLIVTFTGTGEVSGLASIRSIWGSGDQENFEELHGIPIDDARLVHQWAFFDGQQTFGRDWIHVVNPGAGTARVTLSVQGQEVTTADVGPGQNWHYSSATLVGGPVLITSNQPVLTSQRVLWDGVGFSETPGQRLTQDTWFPWYDAVGSDGRDWIVLSNSSPSNTAEATITIGDGPPTPHVVPPNSSVFPTFPGMGGPVHVTSTTPIVVTQRAIWSGFAMEEVPGSSPVSSGRYNWYDAISTGNREWILVANAGSSDAPFKITIAGSQVFCAGDSTFCGGSPNRTALQPGRVVSQRFFGVRDGPMDVIGSDGSSLLISRRSLWGPGPDFTETLPF